MARVRYVDVDAIRTEGLQARAEVCEAAVMEYQESIDSLGAVLPPITVFRDAEKALWLGDGYHRVEAARRSGRKKIAADVRTGSRVDALRFALGANGAHGLRRTNADKANAVHVAYAHRIELGLGEVPSARAVAEVCGLHHTFAGNQLATVASWNSATERAGVDGKVRAVPPVPTRKAAAVKAVAAVSDGGNTVAAVPVRKARGAAAVPEEVKDARGVSVPSRLLEMWNRRSEVGIVAGLVSRARVAIRAAQEAGDPLWAELNVSSVMASLDRAYSEVSAAEPWCVCPMCQGFGCQACKGRGLMGEFRFKTVVPKNMQ